MSSVHYIEEPCLSTAWAKALRAVSTKGVDEVVPLAVSITGFDDGVVIEDANIRSTLETFLRGAGKQSVDTVSNTIFPWSMWNPAAGRKQLFSRYKVALPKLRKASRKNNRGIYFERMIGGGSASNPNQLEFTIGEYLSRKGVRRSILQVAIFDPSKDHSSAAQLGFPCLQHVTFAPVDGTLSVNAFYATQYVVERAYGNYLGLCRLGLFVAHEMKLKLSRVTCFTGIAERDFGKGALAPVFSAIDKAIGPP